MIEITLKDKKSKIYIDEYEAPTEQDLCYIYDSDKRHLNYFSKENQTKDDYTKYINSLQDCWDGIDIFDIFCDSYNYSNISAQDIMQTYVDDILEGHDLDEIKEEVKEILFDIKTMTDDELCHTYDINRIGKIYFRGNW